MAVLRQVTFRFPHDMQIRYVERAPRRGEHVRGLDGELFVVLDAEPNGSREVATCVTPVEYARATRSAGRSVMERTREQCARAARLRRAAISAVQRADATRRSPIRPG